ncbi:protein TALPID3-like isoform X1 [Cyprinus carpio]|uniref:Protein TALPID3-like isoform X1 n=1 Tax=Cyprinus carpio TaxID=7962 RepID=A0A9R0BCF8_CYPCA|nr:protein TALPID3-like isoform X1 [Cyprinus carpio]
MLFCFPLNCNTVHITETNQSCSKHHVQPAETIVECVNMLQAIKLQVYFTRLCCCAVVEDSGLSVNLGSLEEQKEAEVYHRVVTVSSLHPQDTQNQSSQMAQAVHRPAPVLVRQYQGKEEPGEDIFLHTEGGGSDVRVMSVRLPSVKQDQESVSLSSVEGDTESSANDVF